MNEDAESGALTTEGVIGPEQRAKTTAALARCKMYEPGGASSGMRLTSSHPVVMETGTGAYLVDADGNRYIDWLCGYGPLVFGHRPDLILGAITEQIEATGTQFGFPSELSGEVARLIVESVPSVERVRFANTGSEAVQGAVRLARAYTGRDKVLKFEGHYHGQSDGALISVHAPLALAGPEDAPSPVRAGSGIPKAIEDTVVVGTFNDLDGFEALMRRHGPELAAVICEPVMCNSGVIAPVEGWLELMRSLTRDHGALLIYDEVITGFRLSLAGAQGLYAVEPDIACYAKALGGGVPGAAAVGGSSEVMELLGTGDVTYGGTYVANPVSLAGMKATLTYMREHEKEFFTHLSWVGETVAAGLRRIFEDQGVPAQVNQVGPIWSFFFGHEKPVTTHRQAAASDMEFYRDLQAECQSRGVYFHDYPLENWFCSLAHGQNEIDKTFEVLDLALRLVRKRRAVRVAKEKPV